MLRKALYMIRLPSRSLDEAEELQSGDRLSKPSSEFPVKDKLLHDEMLDNMCELFKLGRYLVRGSYVYGVRILTLGGVI